MYNKKNLLNRRFGRLIVIKETAARKNECVVWKCKCDCGKIRLAKSSHLLHKDVKSCGCLYQEHRRLKLGDSGLRRLFEVYKSNSKRRNRVFRFSLEEFQKIVTKTCLYCGQLPSQVMFRKGVSNIATDVSKFLYNGLDRKDNSMGYTKDNCVPCCKVCNFAKHTRSYNEFKLWINKVYKNLCG